MTMQPLPLTRIGRYVDGISGGVLQPAQLCPLRSGQRLSFSTSRAPVPSLAWPAKPQRRPLARYVEPPLVW
jgi:hypothetical protein